MEQERIANGIRLNALEMVRRLEKRRIKAGDRPQVRWKHPCLDENGKIKAGSPCAKRMNVLTTPRDSVQV